MSKIQGPSWQSVLFEWIEACKLDFKGCFEILRLDVFGHYNDFSWNAYCAPSVGPDVGHPQFIFCFLGPILIYFGLYDSKITWMVLKHFYEFWLQIWKFTYNLLFIGGAKTGCSNKKYLIIGKSKPP